MNVTKHLKRCNPQTQHGSQAEVNKISVVWKRPLCGISRLQARPVLLVLFLELFHKGSEGFSLLHCYRVVQRDANSSNWPAEGDKRGHSKQTNPSCILDSLLKYSDKSYSCNSSACVFNRPVSFQRHHSTFGRAFHKLLLQGLVTLFLPHAKRYVHAAPAGRIYRAPETGRHSK